jgi:hypothetical protein
MENEKIETRVIEDTLNPIFMQCLEFKYDFKSLNQAPPVILSIWDADEGFISDSADYLGRAVITLDQTKIKLNEQIPKPSWYPIKHGVGEKAPKSGEILASFSVVEADYNFEKVASAIDLSKYIDSQEYSVSINALGLRDLESIGLFPIQKAYIQFMIKSLTDPVKAGQM